MNFSPDSCVSIDNIKSEVILNVGDEEQRLRSPGFYVTQVKKSLEELSFDTFFNIVYIDLDLPTTLTMDIPKNMWNIKDIFVYNKTAVDCTQPTCDDCSISGMERVFYKRNYLTNGKGYGYTARSVEGNNRDPFIVANRSGSVKYYNVNQGVIMLSPNCEGFDKIRIVANGLVTADITTTKIIPKFIQDAVTLRASERAALSLKPVDPKYRVIWADLRTSLYTAMSRPNASIWDEAKYRMKRKDDKEYSDFKEYLSKGLY